MNFKKGFTLIELLVVIAVIGILAAVVLASLNSAREKGKIASIRSNLRAAVTQAEMYYHDNGATYSGMCSDTKIASIVSAIQTIGALASCYVLPAAPEHDWAIGVIYDTNKFFAAEKSAVLLIDSVNTGSTQTWTLAAADCAAIGKRITGASTLKALYDAAGGTPNSFSAANYHSSTELPTLNTSVYVPRMAVGDILTGAKTVARSTRCAS